MDRREVAPRAGKSLTSRALGSSIGSGRSAMWDDFMSEESGSSTLMGFGSIRLFTTGASMAKKCPVLPVSTMASFVDGEEPSTV